MTSKTTRRFRQALAELPERIRQQARVAYRLFRRDPQHPGLRFKRVCIVQPIYSVRISRDYRALGVVDGKEIVWFWIGSHADCDRLLDQL